MAGDPQLTEAAWWRTTLTRTLLPKATRACMANRINSMFSAFSLLPLTYPPSRFAPRACGQRVLVQAGSPAGRFSCGCAKGSIPCIASEGPTPCAFGLGRIGARGLDLAPLGVRHGHCRAGPAAAAAACWAPTSSTPLPPPPPAILDLAAADPATSDLIAAAGLAAQAQPI